MVSAASIGGTLSRLIAERLANQIGYDEAVTKLVKELERPMECVAAKPIVRRALHGSNYRSR